LPSEPYGHSCWRFAPRPPWLRRLCATGLEIGTLQKLRELDLTDSAVKARMRERYGKNIPLEERMISPPAMYESRLLVPVIQ
jgi:hypothetical protein